MDDRSSDASRVVAAASGATVLAAEQPGYDGALTTGIMAALNTWSV